MKTAKFLAMLLAAFTLTFTLTSCGDDDDDTPAGGNTTSAAGELKIAGKAVKIKSARSFISEAHTEIAFFSEDPENPDAPSDGLNAHVLLNINTYGTTDGRSIPTGTFPYASRTSYEKQEPCYQLLNAGILNEKEGTELWLTALDDCGDIKIEKNGDIYTITIKSLKIAYQKGDQEVTETTSFSYKGKVQVGGM